MNINVVVTVPPYAAYIAEVAEHPLVSGLRLNTVMPVHDTHQAILEKLSQFQKPIWVDLKGRQLRVVEPAMPPFTEVKISHPIDVDTPVDAYLSDGNERVRIVSVQQNRLILEDEPHRMIVPGESINIIHPSLQIHGTLTEADRSYLKAMRCLGMKQVMLSYVQNGHDVEEVQALLPLAECVLKIEDQRGLRFAREKKAGMGRLMAARGDLYVEVLRPHRMIQALQDIILADPQAWVASRLLDSLAWQYVPSSADISDIAWLIGLGYRTFMLGDAVCMKRDTLIEALNVIKSIADEYR